MNYLYKEHPKYVTNKVLLSEVIRFEIIYISIFVEKLIMKRIFIFCLLLFIHNFKSQTFSDIDKISHFIGKTFSELETQLNIKNTGKKTSLGLEHRTYDFKTYFVLVSEHDDSKTIGDMFFLIDENKNYQELWYKIVSEMKKNENYKFIKSFVADKEDKITTEKLDYDQLISLLRSNYKTKEWISEVVFNKENNYYRISYTPVSAGVEIQNKPFEK